MVVGIEEDERLGRYRRLFGRLVEIRMDKNG